MGELLIQDFILKAKESKQHSEEPLACNQIESSNEWVVSRGETIIADELNESSAQCLLDFLQSECHE